MLPQTAAFVLETFRWRPVSAGGMYIPRLEGYIGIDICIYLALKGFAHKATKDIVWVSFYSVLSFIKRLILPWPTLE